jgi:hypothetical protein
VEGLRLRCRAHNQLEAERAFGAGFMAHWREEGRARAGRRREARERTSRDRAAREWAARRRVHASISNASMGQAASMDSKPPAP